MSGFWAEDPLTSFQKGDSFDFETVVVGGSDAKAVPDGVTNWTFFDGALMALIVRTSAGLTAMGTLVGIAPGLAVTATHTLRSELDSLEAGTSTAFCVGPTERGLDLWRVSKISFTESDDILFVSLEIASTIQKGWNMRTMPVTTRAPMPGENLHVVGFRIPTVSKRDDRSIRAEGELLAASGPVTALYYPIRDRFLMPFPTIEIRCGALGGMSGGAVLDEQGHMVGVVSGSLETDDGEGPTFAAWIVGGLNREVQITWPPGLYPCPVHLLDIDNRLLRLEGRDYIRVTSPNSYEYEVWFHR